MTATTTVSRPTKLRRAAVVSAAVLALGAFAGCGGRDDQAISQGTDRPAPAAATQDKSPPSSYTADAPSDTPSGSWESENEYAAEGKRSFMESCERSSGGKSAFCQCVLDELEQNMTFDEFLGQSLDMVKGEEPSEEFMDSVRTCAPSASPGSDGPLNLS